MVNSNDHPTVYTSKRCITQTINASTNPPSTFRVYSFSSVSKSKQYSTVISAQSEANFIFDDREYCGRRPTFWTGDLQTSLNMMVTFGTYDDLVVAYMLRENIIPSVYWQKPLKGRDTLL